MYYHHITFYGNFHEDILLLINLLQDSDQNGATVELSSCTHLTDKKLG